MAKRFILLLLILITISALIPTYTFGSANGNSEFNTENLIQEWVTRTVEILNRALNKQSDDLTIDEDSTSIENKTIKNLYVTTGKGELKLKNVTVTGDLLILGSGEGSVIIEDSAINRLISDVDNENSEILLKRSTTVNTAKIKSNTTLVLDRLENKGLQNINLYINSYVQLKSNKKTGISSSDNTVASISSNTITAKNTGQAIITANINGKKTEISKITVTDPASRTIKILSIGNSFSQDTAYYLSDIAKSAGINVIVGNLYSSGCSLERHWTNALNNEKAYTYYKWEYNDMTELKRQTMKDIILDEEWDYITFQQSSGNSGIYSTYQPYLNKLYKYTKELALNSEVKFALNMTWAYSSKSTNNDFYLYHHNQKTMFSAIVNSYKYASDESGINLIIPCGTAIQNARTNKILNAVGNELTSDGYHLNTGMGRYIAGLTMFESIIREEKIDNDLLEDVNFIPASDENSKKIAILAKKSAKSAVDHPFDIKTIK